MCVIKITLLFLVTLKLERIILVIIMTFVFSVISNSFAFFDTKMTESFFSRSISMKANKIKKIQLLMIPLLKMLILFLDTSVLSYQFDKTGYIDFVIS